MATKKPTDTATLDAKPNPQRKPATTRKAAATVSRKAATPATTQTAAPKKPITPRKTTRSTTPKPAAKATKKPAAKSAGKTGATGWGKVAIAGGVAAVGAAATAALLVLRGSTAVTDLINPEDHAHQADGTDSSASFQAGIADEGTIPS